jgi:hypothetical protein
MKPTQSVEGYLASEKFDQVFSDWLESASTSICKIEKLQEFSIGSEDAGFEAFQRGNSEIYKAKITELFESQLDFYTKMACHGVSFERIRLVKRPFTPYLKYEFLTYKMGARYGEKILIADVTNEQSFSLFSAAEDCLIFDSQRVLVNKYDPTGSWTHGIAIENSTEVGRFIEIINKLRAVSVPLGHYELTHAAELSSEKSV